VARIRANYEALTPREREIMAFVIAGYRNKQIAAEMSVGEATVKLHRGHLMQKMQTQSVAELVWMADALGLGGTIPQP
jgi:FixJ family two-component response regulator